MASRWIGCLVLGLAACGEDLPRCADVDGSVSVDGDGHGLYAGQPMVVVAPSADDWLDLEDTLGCDPIGDPTFSIRTLPDDADAWLPPAGRQVIAQLWLRDWSGSWGEVRSPDGVAIFEGGTIVVDPEEDPHRFRVEATEGGEECAMTRQCVVQAPAHVLLQTDDGEIRLTAGERRTVTIDGEPMLALVARAFTSRMTYPTCVTDFSGGPQASVMLARTTALELPVADSCPE